MLQFSKMYSENIWKHFYASQEKPHLRILAPERVCKTKHLIKAHSITLKHVPGPHLEGSGITEKSSPETSDLFKIVQTNSVCYNYHVVCICPNPEW